MHYRFCLETIHFVKIDSMRSSPKAAVALLICVFAPFSAWTQQLGCKPCNYNFGKVPVSTTANGFFVLKNSGSTTLRITADSIQGNAFSFGSFKLPVKLQPGASIELPVNFTPAQRGQAQGVITITSSDPKSPLTLNVGGSGLAQNTRELTLSPSALNFGNVTVGTTGSLPVTLTASNGSVIVSSDQSNSSEFSITGLTFPVKILKGTSVQATIQFTPNASGTANAQSEFFSNAVDSPTSEQLTGTGVAQAQHDAYLTWNQGDSSAVGYNIYRGTVHGGPYQQLNSSLDASTDYTDYTVDGGKVYYYVATEVNIQGQESAYSSEIKVKIPKS
jgi:hypothetical protein